MKVRSMPKLPIKGVAHKKLDEVIKRLKQEGKYDVKKSKKKSSSESKTRPGSKQKTSVPDSEA